MKKFLLVAIWISSICFSQNVEPRFVKMDSLLSYLYKNNKFMGGLTIREGETIIFSKNYGFFDIKQEQKSNINTAYKIGSITKTFTAVIVMQLIDERKLRLETKLSKFFPKIPNAHLISINELLHHRTGIKDYVNQDSITKNDLAQKDLKKTILKKIESYSSNFEPNSQVAYSNSNYFLLGLIIENLTQMSYAENVQKRIASKIGLKNTYYPDESVDFFKNNSTSFYFDKSQWITKDELPVDVAFATGGIVSTTEDLTLTIHELFDGKLVSKKALEELKKMKDGYGKGLMQFPFGERKFYGHNGKIENFVSVLGYYPNEKLSVSLTINGNNYNANDIIIGVLSIYYKIPFPFPHFFTIDKQSILAFTGTYKSPDIPLKLTVFFEDDTLKARATGQSSFPLSAKNENTFIFSAANIEIVFEKDSLVLKQAGSKFKFTKE